MTNEQLISAMGKLSIFLNLRLYDVAAGFDETELADERLAGFSDETKEAARLMLYAQEYSEDGSAAILYDDIENMAPDAPVLRGQAGMTLCTLLKNIGIISY